MLRSSPSPRSRRMRCEYLESRMCLASYSAVDLVPLVGHEYSIAIGVNDQSVAVGRSHDYDSDDRSAVVWQVDENGAASVWALPGLNGQPSSGANEVNNEAMIAGASRYLIDGQYFGHAVVWTGTPGNHAPHDLGTLGPTYVWAEAFSLSEPDANGHVWLAGYSGTDANVTPHVVRAVLWQVNASGDLISTIDLEPTAVEARANDVRVIDGSVIVAGQVGDQAVIWETNLSGNLIARSELSTVDYQTTVASALNGAGNVVGQGIAPGEYQHGFFYDGNNVTDLGTLGNSLSRANGINDHDVIVGTYDVVKTQGFYSIQSIAFIWQDGTMETLIDQVSARDFVYLFAAYDINSDGGIVGTGRLSKKLGSEQHGFLLKPENVDPPSGSNAIYVYDIGFESKRGGKDWRAVFEIRTDSNGNDAGDADDSPIAGVQIEVIFAGTTYTGTTDSNGIFRSSWIRNLAGGDYYANAVDLALTGYNWDTLLDLEDDSDFILGPDAVLEL